MWMTGWPWFKVGEHPGLKSGGNSTVPTGLLVLLYPTQDFILGYSQSSLRDWFPFHASQSEKSYFGQVCSGLAAATLHLCWLLMR